MNLSRFDRIPHGRLSPGFAFSLTGDLCPVCLVMQKPGYREYHAECE